MEFKTKKEWEAAADKMFADGVSPQEINKTIGTYSGPEGTFTIQQAAKSKRGFTVVDKDKRAKRNQKRKAAIAEQDTKLVDTLVKGGMSEKEALEILEKEKAGYARIEEQAAELNKEHGKGAFNAGHETAALEGGGNYGRNARVEIGKSRTRADGTRMRGNQSRGRIDEAPDSIKPAMGIPRSGRGGEDTALINLLEKDYPGIMDLGLTPQDRQNIKRNPAAADDIIAARQAQIAVNPLAKPNPNRVTTFQPNLNVKAGSLTVDTAGMVGRGLTRSILPSAFAGGVSLVLGAGDVKAREERAEQDPSFINNLQVQLAQTERAADIAGMVPGPHTPVSEPTGLGAGLANVAIDIARDPIGTLKAVGGGIKWLVDGGAARQQSQILNPLSKRL